MRQDRLLPILGRIIQRPETWDQSVYSTRTACGTAHCVAGHAWCDANRTPIETYANYSNTVWDTAQEWLGLTDVQAGYLFDSVRTLDELIEFGMNPVGDPYRTRQ